MTRPALRTVRRAVRWPRPLLLAALLLGIVTMHTLGHPAQGHAMEDAPAGHSVARTAAAAAHAPDHGQGASGTPGTPGTAADDTTAGALLSGIGNGLGTGMDPMSVCLAVLAALILLILGAGLAGPRRAAPLGGAARAPGRSGGPDPPPPRELLTRLAVLRV
ncbi:hypothetical protein ACFWBF_29320 [Streptomyces sp. NPDC060028]|uniref:hypothetical protein n=1 Tax=Streptomyces sp. NPDC060028 TaxID=3347041 RepID=UPI003688A089